jgi:hypothetical protein
MEGNFRGRDEADGTGVSADGVGLTGAIAVLEVEAEGLTAIGPV